MADNEPTISMAGINAPPLYRLVEDGDKTVIVTADTNTPMWVINGKIAGGGVEVMATDERMSITPEAGDLIYDTDIGSLFVGDGVTAGGVEVSGSEDEIAALNARLTVAEEDILIIKGGGTPIQGSYSLGDWTPDFEDVVQFGGWTAASI